ncbi:hypothetical protein [Trichothermofontia sp.]
MRLFTSLVRVPASDVPSETLAIPASPVLDALAVELDSLDSNVLNFQLPDPEDEHLPEVEFQQQVDRAWQVCDRFDLQTDIWRGRILRVVRDRERKRGDHRGTGFLNWLKEREISKSQAYQWIELANSADTLLETGHLEPADVNQFSKRAFIEAAQASPEVQQLVSEAAHRGERVTRREVRQLSEEWTAMTSDLLPEEVREKVADHTIPSRYLAPLVRELEKLPEAHQASLQHEMRENPDLDTLKQVTSEAKSLAKYLNAATQVQALNDADVDLETALEEALRLGILNIAADVVTQATQVEQAIGKLYTAWKRLNRLSDRLYVDSGTTTPHLRRLVQHLGKLSGSIIEVQLGVGGDPTTAALSQRTIRLQMLTEEMDAPDIDHD